MQLDNKALEVCKKMEDKRASEIAEVLAGKGYVNKNNEPVSGANVQYFMRGHGIRCFGMHFEKKAKKKSTAARFTGASLVKDVEEVVTSNLSPEMKERVLRGFLG